ncbi:Hsp20/alpha crystallin family protein [Desulfovibrio sp. OttesenSCG-928-I05]|nr:Hsp20/alpha crystallin family protein [Desulfovibrio sp. OttesenSCG-928-I05]
MSQHFRAFFDLTSLFESFTNESAPSGRFAAYSAERMAGEAFPPMQLCEDADSIHLRALLPGASLSALSLEIVDNNLILRGTLPAVKGHYHRHERYVGDFHRVIPLPSAISEGPLEAVLHNGVLSVTLPKDVSCRRRSIRVLYAADTEPCHD